MTLVTSEVVLRSYWSRSYVSLTLTVPYVGVGLKYVGRSICQSNRRILRCPDEGVSRVPVFYRPLPGDPDDRLGVVWALSETVVTKTPEPFIYVTQTFVVLSEDRSVPGSQPIPLLSNEPRVLLFPPKEYPESLSELYQEFLFPDLTKCRTNV